jgi:hypothetical protein
MVQQQVRGGIGGCHGQLRGGWLFACAARYVEMASWPRMERVSESFGSTLKRAIIESFYPSPAAEGVSVMFDRDKMIEARIRCAAALGSLTSHHL